MKQRISSNFNTTLTQHHRAANDKRNCKTSLTEYPEGIIRGLIAEIHHLGYYKLRQLRCIIGAKLQGLKFNID